MKKSKIYIAILTIFLLFTSSSLASNEITTNNVINSENVIDESSLIRAIEEGNLSEETSEDQDLSSEDSNEEVLKEGIYNIKSILADNRLIEIPESNKSKKAYLKLGTEETTANEKFKISYNADGTYTLSVLHSQLCIDVENGKAGNRVKVWQYSSNESDAQKWYIEKNEDGTYSFISKLGNYALDINNGKSAVGTDLQIYRNNGSDSQKFELVECSKEKGTQTIEDGTYKIIPQLNTQKSLEVIDGEVKINDILDSTNQKYEFKYDGNGYYKIFTSNKVLTVDKDNTKRVYEAEDEDLDTQKWIVKKQDNVYNIVSKYSNLYLDLANGSTSNGTKLQIYRQNDSDAQKFQFIRMEQILEEGIYNINSVLADNRLIEIPESNKTKKSYFKLGTEETTANEKFKISYNADGTYTLSVLHSQLCMDVENGKAGNRVKVWQYSSNGSDAQKWYIIKNSDNTYSFISKLGNYALDVNNGKSTVGTDLQIYRNNGSDSQKFELVECSKEKGTQLIEDSTYRIITKANRSKSLTLTNGEIELADDQNIENQKYEFKYDGDGYYKIYIPNTTKVLTVDEDNTKRVYEAEDEDLDTQKWIVKKQETVYNIVSKYSNLYLDITNGKTDDGTKLQIYRQNDSESQKFILVNLTPTKDIVTDFEDGIYQIVLTNGNVIDVAGGSYNNKANIQTWENDKVQQQKFRIQKIEGTKYYRITAIHSAKSLDVPNGSCKIGTNVQQYTVDEDTPNQQWYLKDAGDGYYNIISLKNGLYIDVSGGVSSKNGQNIQLWSENGTNSQKFKLKAIDIINEDEYQIQTVLNDEMILDVLDESKLDDAKVQIYEWEAKDSQKLILKSLTNEDYSITFKHSNKVLTVKDDGTVVQNTYDDKDNQKWTIKELGNDNYRLISKFNNESLSISDSDIINGTNMQTQKSDDIDIQEFKFVHKKDFYTIVLNPGHGGSSTGCAYGNQIIEKDVTLKLAKRIQSNLSKYDRIKVILTRTGDYEMDLDDRAMIAREKNADLYVSLHINDEPSHTMTGSQVYIPFYEGKREYNSNMSYLANLIQNELFKIGITKNRIEGITKRCVSKEPKYQYLMDGKVVQADYYADIRHAMKGDTNSYGPDLNTNTGIPTVLVEHCFMNSSDRKFLDSTNDLNKIADADTRAILEYFNLD